MEIGISTQIYWDYEELDLPGTIEHVVEDLGFEALEIHCEDPLFEAWGREEGEETKRKVKEALSAVEAEATLHGPFHDLNLATLNQRVREEVLRQHEEAIEFADFIGSEVIVVHPGFISSRKFKRERCEEVLIQNLEKLSKKAADHGVKLCLENLARKRKVIGASISEVRRILEEADHENLEMTLDVAHAN
ncbi:MAG: sugar phosphate isomerase/epimerase family protein, partial [Candidatus Aenigmatarchaeota archaeon]